MSIFGFFRGTPEEKKYTAELTVTPTSGLKIDDFVKNRKNPTPGNVGVCLSGGGSRAMTAAMGQLRALKKLNNGQGDLLSQTKAISTVSGGSWLGVTFSYLNDANVSDDDYLNTYVDDPSKLVLSKTPGHSLAETLDELPKGNMGENITSKFSVIDVAVQAFLLYKFHGTPANLLWQTVIANRLLKPYNLYTPGEDRAPTSYYTYNESTITQLQNLPDQNPGFINLVGHKLVNNTLRVERPFVICNTAMFVNNAEPNMPLNKDGFEFLAPVQCTPFFTGIVGHPGGTDANGKKPGGGGVSSFSFNSELVNTNVDSNQNIVSVSETRPFSLLDCVGSSSAAFAETLQNIFEEWEADFGKFLNDVEQRGDTAVEALKDQLPTDELTPLHEFVNTLKSTKAVAKTGREFQKLLGDVEIIPSEFKVGIDVPDPKDIIPQYYYWPVVNATAEKDIKPTRFADGGSLENTGIAAMLTYQDIDNVIAFVNSSTLLAPVNEPSSLQIDQFTKKITTNIKIDSQIPPLFGYQPFNSENKTYSLYKDDSNPESPEFLNNKIFLAEKFPEFLQGIWDATKDGDTAPATLKQTLTVLENTWFGVKARNSVNVVWVYTNWVDNWATQLSDGVKELLPDDFPHYGTLDTELSKTEINLLSNLTAWCVADPGNSKVFTDLYL